MLWCLRISWLSWRLARRKNENWLHWASGPSCPSGTTWQEMSDSLSNTMKFINTFFFRMIFLNGVTQRPFFVLFTKNCNLNVATFHAHLFQPYEDSNYLNYVMVKVSANLCHVKRGCACNLQHAQLFEYKRLLFICTATREGENLCKPCRIFKHLIILSTRCSHSWKSTNKVP